MDEEIRSFVRIEYVGEPQGLKKGGIRTIVTDQAEVKCMPQSLPESISIDVSSLEVGDAARNFAETEGSVAGGGCR